MEEKKSLLMVSTLVRIIIFTAIFFLILLPAWNKVEAAFFNSGQKSFEAFVDKINGMVQYPKKTESVVLELNDKSAVIGFSKNTDAYRCYCGSKWSGPSIVERLNVIINKPNVPECIADACICLCDIKTETKDILGSGSGLIGRCENSICKKLNGGMDITPKTNMKPDDGSIPQYWDRGFLFANGFNNLNGMQMSMDKINTIYIQKEGNIIGVCDGNMLQYNKDKLKLQENACINNDVKAS